MLVLTRRLGETIVIDNYIEVTVTDIQGGQVRLGIKAPPSVHIVRRELVGKPRPAPAAVPLPVSANGAVVSYQTSTPVPDPVETLDTLLP